ncbi:MAG: helix-turn-helix domain-containing protein [Candidatus Pacearchaeota archaeon]|jgi:predicted transcriptional regulator
MEINDLIVFGMTKTEAKIYLEILKVGETAIGLIIQLTGLHRGTVYNSIVNLIEKGFVSFIDKEGVRYYRVSGDRIFKNIIESKEKEIVKEKKELTKFFEEMNNIHKDKNNQEVQVFYGVEAFKSNFINIYEDCKRENCEYLFLGKGGVMQDAVGAGFYRYTQRLKKKMKIKCRVILDEENKKHSYHKYVFGNVRHLTTKLQSPVNFWIYQDLVLMVLFESNPLTTIKVKSKSLSDSFRNYFEYLWTISRK